MRFHALINLYNDRVFLAACLESLIDFTDSIIIADGAYRLYYERFKEFDPQAQPYSTDGSLAIIKGFRGLPDIQILNNGYECWENQAVKRTALLDAVPIGDWFLIIDADEMMCGDVQEGLERIYESGCLCANMPLYNPGTEVERVTRQWHPRIFKKLDGMNYKGTHWHLRDRFGRIIEASYPIHWANCMAIVHFKAFKPQARLMPHEGYMRDLAERGWIEPAERKENV